VELPVVSPFGDLSNAFLPMVNREQALSYLSGLFERNHSEQGFGRTFRISQSARGHTCVSLTSELPTAGRLDSTPSRAVGSCAGRDWADVVAQFPGRHVDVVILDAHLHVRVVGVEGDRDLIRGVADDIEG
jgi:hypothetical protein